MEQLVFVTLSLTKGGAERVICNMCNEHFAERYHITIISLMAAEPEYRLDERIRLIRLDETIKQAEQNLASRFLRRRKALLRVLRQLEKEGKRPLALISFLPEPNMIVCSLKRTLKLPVIISVRNAPTVEYRGKVRYLLMRVLYPHADAYVFQTKEAKGYFSFSRHITAHSAVIPNPLSAEFTGDMHERADKIAGQREGFRVLAVGRLEAQKNYERLLAVFEAFHKKCRESSLMICGEGSERAKTQQFVAEHGLSGCVSLPGNVDDIAAQYEAADAYLMTSDYEGMPNALLEAMACGLPVIVTDCPCGAPAELVQSGENGILIPMRNEEQIRTELLEGLERLYAEPEFADRLGEKAKNVRNTLSPKRIYVQWEALIMRTSEGKE